MLIEALAPEQEAKFPEYVREWTGYGLSTEPADRPRAEAAIRLMYQAVNLEAPKNIIWCDSPLSMAITRATLKKNASVWGSVGDSVWASVRASVGDSVRASVGASVRASVGASVWASVGDSVWGSVGDSVRGQHEAGILSFYKFFAEECGLYAEAKPLLGLWELCQSCGWIMPHETICFASERHNVCRLENGLIHCDSGPAIAYPDGFEIYAFNGVRLPKRWVMEKNEIDPLEILRAENADERAAGLALIGWDRALSHLDHTVIDETGNPQHGQLLEITLPDVGSGLYLRAHCPRNGWIIQGVNPDEMYARTTHAAQAWCAGLPKHMQKQFYQYPTARS